MDALQRQDGANSVQTAAEEQAKKMILDGILQYAIELEVAGCLRKPRISLGNHPVTCRTLMEDVLDGPDTVFLDLFKLDRTQFGALSKWAEDTGTIQDGKNYTVWQKLMIFLHVVGNHVSYRNVSNRFKISIGSIHQIFNQVLVALAHHLYDEFVTQPGPEYVSEYVELNPRYSQFNGCIGAVDGAHIPAFVPPERQHVCRNRKGELTQNVFAAVKFDLTFTYVLAGAAGSMKDAQLFKEALCDEFEIPTGRFYLGDGGFEQNARGLVVPYEGERYHLRDFEGVDIESLSMKDRFNRHHAEMRCIVERVFGILKEVFPVLKGPAMELNWDQQRCIVYALVGIWNFVRKQRMAEGQGGHISDADELRLVLAAQKADSRIGDKKGREIRDLVALAM
ncbi:uncharacterized protein CPUR_06444 [Claviceps purpurea 20.1]|uniref:Uncharacterized protein n=1 Tax=Claviceps purpurea (strain 20.1) TaxID=1111077 RepID=M1WHE3_CLAP2|nr:uncharacterized protein CPUR_06444 [Claviceps purpurea 20.1]